MIYPERTGAGGVRKQSRSNGEKQEQVKGGKKAEGDWSLITPPEGRGWCQNKLV
jgi:hypothetical protein